MDQNQPLLIKCDHLDPRILIELLVSRSETLFNEIQINDF